MGRPKKAKETNEEQTEKAEKVEIVETDIKTPETDPLPPPKNSLSRRGRKNKYAPLVLDEKDYPVEDTGAYEPKDYVKDIKGRKWRIHPKTKMWVLANHFGKRTKDSKKANSESVGDASSQSSSESRKRAREEKRLTKVANRAATSIQKEGTQEAVPRVPRKNKPGAGRPKLLDAVTSKQGTDISKCKIGAITTVPDEQGFLWIVKKSENSETFGKEWVKISSTTV